MCRLGRARPRYAVALSGFGMTADRARSRAVGFRHHLVKPQGIENLPAVLREAARECRQPLSRPEHSLQH
jgi:CheY-like chemotaxis protein